MKSKLLYTVLSILLISAPLSIHAQDKVTIKSDIYVAEDEIRANVFSFGGNIIIKGKVKESVVSLGGSITVEGEVGEEILGIGSDIYLKSGSTVMGDIVSIGGSITRDPGTTINGDTLYFKSPGDLFTKKTLRSSHIFSLYLIFKLITSFIWLIFAIVLALILPRQIYYASDQINESFGPIFGTGLLSLILFMALCLFSVLLSLLVIGIPILFSLILLALIIKILGNVIIFHFFGKSIAKPFGTSHPSILMSIFLGFILITLLTSIPILGVLISFLLTIMAWGVVIRTKFGTTENWFKRKLPEETNT
ncbi:MAG: hypothetical protein J7L72_06830 [Candidatus Aminicenantes bacterium]|nr:hypothetical protein [Candidatus Aminicenantes bacterium]